MSSAPISISLAVGNMSCASCVGRVERALAEVPGVEAATVNLATERAQVTLRDADALRGAVARLDDTAYPVRRETIQLQVGGLHCASCVGRAERALAVVPGVEDVAVNLATETATITIYAGVVPPSDLARAATQAGYPARLAAAQAPQDHAAEKAAEAELARRRALLAGALTLPVFVLEMGAHMIPAFHHWIMGGMGQQTSWLLQWVLTTVVLAGPGRVFYRAGLPALAKGAPDMNSLVALGTAAAYLYSLVALFLPSLLPAGTVAVYFEAAAVIVTLILLGRFMEARAKGRTGAAIRALMGLQARHARVLRKGVAIDVAIEEIGVGEQVILRPGERVAVDGTVTDGESFIDESMLTGEAIPVSKAPGDPVTGGTVNGAGSLTLCATRVGADTTLAQIIRMVQEAQGAKLPIQALVDRVTLYFVPAVMAVAAATVLAWLIFGPDPAVSFALVAGVSVLIIACPCAMGLATPTSIMVGTGRAAELGVLFRRGSALQQLGDVGIVAFDKTGTLTEGRPDLTDVVLAPGAERRSVLADVAALEARSEHPIADAICRGARAEGVADLAVEGFTAWPGYGVGGTVEGRAVLVGAARLMAREGIDIGALATAEAGLAARGRTALFAAIDGRVAAVLGVADAVKPGARAAVEALMARGLRVAMITGDGRATAEAIAADLGITEVVAEVLPAGKVAALSRVSEGGARVAFVGDGINDAPALAAADVGLAIGTGTDVAIESADVVLMSGDLAGVVNAVEVSRRTMGNIRQNLVWAFAYNSALIPVAAGVFYPVMGVLLSPMFAAGAMALSSVSVLANALRLRRVRPVLREGAAAPGRAPMPAAAQEKGGTI